MHTPNNVKKRIRTQWIVFGISTYIFLLISILVFISMAKPSAPSPNNIASYADKIIERCANAEYRPGCYDNELPKFMSTRSMEETIKIANTIQHKDASYAYCHALGHKVARVEVRKNPSKWKEVYKRCPLSTCANGCQHGVLQEKYQAESLTDEQREKIIPDLKQLCETSSSGGVPTSFEKLNCYHGLGHMTMFMTDGDIAKSQKLCDEIGVKTNGEDVTNVCYDGLFMQVFQPQEPEDVALVKDIRPEKETLAAFCKQFLTDLRQEVCWSQGWVYFSEELNTAKGVEAFCNIADIPIDKSRCYDTAFHGIAQINGFNRDDAVRLCNEMQENLQSQCFIAHISAMFNAERSLIGSAIALCEYGKNSSVRDQCYDGVILHAKINFHHSSPFYSHACSLLPETKKKLCQQSG